jgi:hypothetical protein
MTTKKSDEYSQSEESAYVKAMTESFKALNIEKKPVSTVQAASTQKLLSMTDEEAANHKKQRMFEWDNNINPTWNDQNRAEKDAEKVFAESVAKSPTRFMDSMRAENLRRDSKNTMGDAVSYGATGFSENTKEAARQGFSYTPPAPLTKEQTARLTELNIITEYEGPVPEKPKKKSWFQKVFGQDETHVSWRDLPWNKK